MSLNLFYNNDFDDSDDFDDKLYYAKKCYTNKKSRLFALFHQIILQKTQKIFTGSFSNI